MTELLFSIFASLAIGGAIGMIAGKNPIASLLFLVLTFFSLAGIYVLLGAHFIAVTQVIVYAGAIMVLFLFVIMLLNLGHEYRADVRRGVWIIAGFTATGVIGYLIADALIRPELVADVGAASTIEAGVRDMGAVAVIAQPLFRDFLVPFELTSILLLAAIIGAVLLAKRRI